MSKKKYKFKCPRCEKEFTEFYGIQLTPKDVKGLAAVSRRDNKIKICVECGEAEGNFDYYLRDKKDSDKVFLPWDPRICTTVVEARRIERSWL